MDLSTATLRQSDPYSFHDSGGEEEMPEYRRPIEYPSSEIRNHQYNDDLKDQNQHQSSRRKQSKPIRVQHLEAEAQNVVRVEPESPEHQRQGTPYETRNCPDCTEQFTNEDSLRDHIQNAHGTASPNQNNSYPTDYHRLGRELSENEEAPPPEWPADYNPEDGIPVDRRSDKKIFHQDAFCDLCDREFCNKYFLKTHLANKHGIYDDLPPYSQNSQVPTSMYPMYLHGAPTMVPPPRPPVEPHMEGRQSPLNMSVTPTSSSSPSSKPETPGIYGNPLFSKSPNSRENDYSRPPPPSADGKGPIIAQDGSIELKDKQQRSMDDFCELCQKHFCNKYYLRKHKMDVHGIQSEPYSAKRRHSSNLLSMASPVLLPQNIPTSMANMMLMNPFGPMFPNPMFPMPHMPGMPELPPHMKSPQNRDRENEPRPPQGEPTIKNPDAYCDICRKEFCDKYYLKVHKANMHNIQDDNSHSLPTFVPQPQPRLDARSLEIARNLDRDRYAREKFERENREHQQKFEPKYDHNKYDPKYDNKYEQKFEHKYEQKYENKYEPKYEPKFENKSDLFEFEREKYEGRFDAEYQRRYLQAKQESRVEERKRDDIPMDFSSPQNNERRHTPPSSMPPVSTSLPPTPMDAKIEHRPRKCDVCHKEFADKYALRIHRLNIHGLVHGQPAPQPVPQDVKPEPKPESQTPPGYASSPFPPHTPPRSSFGMDRMDLPPSTIPMPMSSMGLPFTPPNSLNTSSDNPMSTMFSSMVTAKLADRVTCDICNKEVCNKYFLKTHKIKMHGVDPASVGKEMPKEPKKPKPAVSPQVQPKFTDLPRTPIKPVIEEPINPARQEELLKMGIDPEAYCEICKKEFCSKYFLRTHKLNMHGIPTDKPGNRKEDREISRREIMERELMAMRDFGLFPGAMYPTMPGMPGLPPPPMHNPYPFPPLPTVNQVRQADEESLDSNKSSDSKSTKSNKEPANAIRVKCEICSKELCNKYFLRTHKLNKHGIVDDTLSEGQQRKFLEMQQKGLLPENPFLLKEGLSPLENFIKRDAEMGLTKPNANGVFSSLDPNVIGSNFGRNFFMNSPPKDDKDESEEANLLRDFTEVCNVCQRRFTSVEWLKTHMSVEHGMKSEHDTELIRKKMELACQACGMIFPDKIGLQIHLVQEHGVGINLTPEPTTEPREKEPQPMDTDNNNLSLKLKRKYSRILVKRKVHTCSKCDYRTLFVKNLLNHEERAHGIKSRRYRCKNCFKRFKQESALRKHGLDCRERKVEIQNGQFHCKLCSETFLTRRACRLHVYKLHTEKFRCSECGYQAENQKRLSFHCRLKHGVQRPALQPVNGHMNGVNDEKMPVCYSTPCDLKSQASFIMQPFTLRDENGFNHFVKAVVYLPVYQKINEPITVDFHLTPTDK